jgi:hypothetical protein
LAQKKSRNYVRIKSKSEVSNWLYPSAEEANDVAKQLRKNPDFKQETITVVSEEKEED